MHKTFFFLHNMCTVIIGFAGERVAIVAIVDIVAKVAIVDIVAKVAIVAIVDIVDIVVHSSVNDY